MAERTSVPKPDPKPKSPARPEDDSIASKREQLYASRRASAHSASPDSPRSTGARRAVSSSVDPSDDAPTLPMHPDAPAPKVSRPILAAGIVVLAGVVLFGAFTIVGSIQRGSPEGKLKHAMLETDLQTPELAAREAAFAKIDAGADGPKLALALLEDVGTAQEGSSRSSHTYRELAAEYLLARAASTKIAPPAQAANVAATIRSGRRPSEADWKELHDAWATWIAAQTAK